MSASENRPDIKITAGRIGEVTGGIICGDLVVVTGTFVSAATAAPLTLADLHLLTMSLRLRLSDALLGKIALAVAANSLVLQWAGYRQDAEEYARPAPPPVVTTVVERPDPAEIERIVDERLRERDQQRSTERALREHSGEPDK